MAAQYYKINYKSDFVLTINSDAGWAVPFCIKFWTGMPSHGYFAGFDGENYVNCRVGDEPTQLLVMFDDHHMPIGPLRMQIAYHTTIEEFPDRQFDEVTNPTNVTVDIDGTEYQVMLDFTGETGAEIDFSMPSSGVMSVNGKIGYVTLTAEDVGAQPTIEDLATIRSGAAEGATAVQPAELQQGLATKQNVINDLATIRSGAAAGATAVQPAELQQGLATKQNVINDLATIRSGAAAGATAYQKPGTGIPESDLASGVQSSLHKADAAAPQSNTYTKGEVDTLIAGAGSDIDVDDALSTTSENPVQNKVLTTALNGKQDVISDLSTIRSGAAAGATAVQPAALQEGLAGKQDTISDLATIRSGAAAGATAVQPAALTLIENDIDAIEGKIPSAASTSNQLADKAFVNSALSGKADTSDIPTALSQLSQDSTHRVVTDAEKSTWNGKQNAIDDLATIRSGAAAGATAVQPAAMNTALAAKQDTLTFDNTPTANSSNPVKSSGIKTALDAKQSTISTVNVTVDNNTGTPSGSASVSGSTLSLSFQNLKGATGATGATGPQGPQGERGLPGESGVTGDVSGFTVIQTIDPSATYGATDIAGAATVQATNQELTELAGEVSYIADGMIKEYNGTVAAYATFLTNIPLKANVKYIFHAKITNAAVTNCSFLVKDSSNTTLKEFKITTGGTEAEGEYTPTVDVVANFRISYGQNDAGNITFTIYDTSVPTNNNLNKRLNKYFDGEIYNDSFSVIGNGTSQQTLKIADGNNIESVYYLNVREIIYPQGATNLPSIYFRTFDINGNRLDNLRFTGSNQTYTISPADGSVSWQLLFLCTVSGTSSVGSEYGGTVTLSTKSYAENLLDGLAENIVTTETINLFNPNPLLLVNECVKNNDGSFTFKSGNANTLYSNGYPLDFTFKANTPYTLYFECRNTDLPSSYSGFSFVFEYTDGTSERIYTYGGNTFTKYHATSNSSKTVSKIKVTYGYNGITSIRNIMLVEGDSYPSLFIPYNGTFCAIDSAAREKIFDEEKAITEIKDYIGGEIYNGSFTVIGNGSSQQNILLAEGNIYDSIKFELNVANLTYDGANYSRIYFRSFDANNNRLDNNNYTSGAIATINPNTEAVRWQLLFFCTVANYNVVDFEYGGTVIFSVNGKMGNDYATKEDLQDAIDGIDIGPTGRNILWVGTSIPEGCPYPQNACANLRHTCYNKSLGSSGICLNSGYLDSGRDGKDLCESASEKEARYRQYVTAGTITEATLTTWKTYGYDKRIIPYIDGTLASCDTVVFDHGINDRGVILNEVSNLANMDFSTDLQDEQYDRTSFAGAFCFLVKKIWEVNPSIKIIICSYLENVSGNTMAQGAHCGIYIDQELKYLSKQFNFPYLNMCDYNGFTYARIPNSSNYIASVNEANGTNWELKRYYGYTGDNVTRYQYYCPDGLHPHTDLTGRALSILTSSVTKLLRDL